MTRACVVVPEIGEVNCEAHRSAPRSSKSGIRFEYTCVRILALSVYSDGMAIKRSLSITTAEFLRLKLSLGHPETCSSV